MYLQCMCILLYVKLMLCNYIPYMYGQMEWGGRCILSISALCYMWDIFGVMVFQRSIVNWSGGYMYPQCMFILQYVKFIWCNGIPYIYGQLGGTYAWSICTLCYTLHIFGVVVWIHLWWIGVGGTYILSICACCYMWNLFGVMVFHRSIVNWTERVHVSSVYVHSVICETYVW